MLCEYQRKPTSTMGLITSGSFHDRRHKAAAYHTMAIFMVNILLSCPVFARMLSNTNYKESQQSTMKITDTSADIFGIFLKFIYTADVPDLPISDAVEVLKLAEKYDMGDLKNICEKFLYTKLKQSDPVFDIYIFAHQYNCCQPLIEKAFAFVEKNYFIGKSLPENLCDNPSEVQRLVTKMKEFDETLKEIHEDLVNPTKKIRKSN